MVADLLAVVVVLGLFGIGGRGLFSAWNARTDRQRKDREDQSRMRDDLRKALESHDRARLEDFLVLWGDKLDDKGRAHIQARIDDLLLEKEM